MKTQIFASVSLMLILLSVSVTAADMNTLTADDNDIIEVVVTQVVLHHVTADWRIPSQQANLVLSDKSIATVFPMSADQAAQAKIGLPPSDDPMTVDWEALMVGHPDTSKDFTLSGGSIIPKDLVSDLLRRSKASVRFSQLPPGLQSKVQIEKEEGINASQKSVEALAQFMMSHPLSAGVLRLGVPGYTSDKNTAALYYSAMGIKGTNAVADLVLLQRKNGKWAVKSINLVMSQGVMP